MGDLPLHGVSETELPPHPAAAGLADDADEQTVRALVAASPTFLDGWARLAEFALERGDAVTAYAFARTGYHRGLDAIRRAGWRGQGPVPWRHEPNRGFLRSVHALFRASDAVGEQDEVHRLREFLVQLDPDDTLGVGTGR